MTEKRRRTYTAPFKAKVGLEASRKVQTTNEVAQAYRAHPPPLLRQQENSTPYPTHRVYPYLLRGVTITRPDQVWSADITSIRLAYGFTYLMAIMDWYSRRVLADERAHQALGCLTPASVYRAGFGRNAEINNHFNTGTPVPFRLRFAPPKWYRKEELGQR
jgi:transposase InsO family protein